MVLQPLLCHLAFEITLYCWSGPENNLWFSIHSPGWAVSCYLREGRAPKCWPVPSLPHRLLLLLKGKNDSGSGFSQIFDPDPGPREKRTILPETLRNPDPVPPLISERKLDARYGIFCPWNRKLDMLVVLTWDTT